MLKLLALVGAAFAVGCGTAASCKCGDGQVCVYDSLGSRCAVPCANDAGSCSAGQSCGCASSCAGCKDCLLVCK